MTCAEYCKSCCKKDVCQYRASFIEYGDVTDEAVKKYPDFITNDIRCKYYQQSLREKER